MVPLPPSEVLSPSATTPRHSPPSQPLLLSSVGEREIREEGGKHLLDQPISPALRGGEDRDLSLWLDS